MGAFLGACLVNTVKEINILQTTDQCKTIAYSYNSQKYQQKTKNSSLLKYACVFQS